MVQRGSFLLCFGQAQTDRMMQSYLLCFHNKEAVNTLLIPCVPICLHATMKN